MTLPITSSNEIETFLIQCGRTVSRSFVLARRTKNKQTLLTLGFNYQNVIDEISSLSVENYSEGPLQDRNYAEEIWIFGKMIQGMEVYIKIQLSKYNDPGELIDTVYCISFHFADDKLNYLYKE